MAKPSIWCLFSVENNYDQPQNNLVRFWFDKPSIEELARFMACPLDSANNEKIVAVVDCWQGHSTQFPHSDTRYRLQEVEEGEGL